MRKHEGAIKVTVGIPLAPDHKIGFIGKAFAIIGLNPRLDYCPRHRIFFWQSSDPFTITVCPKCARGRNLVVGATGK